MGLDENEINSVLYIFKLLTWSELSSEVIKTSRGYLERDRKVES